MPLYFFDLHDEHLTTPDEEGTVCADMRAVSETAIKALTDIAADEPMRAGHRKLFTTVRDEAGCVIYTAALHITDSWLQMPVRVPPYRGSTLLREVHEPLDTEEDLVWGAPVLPEGITTRVSVGGVSDGAAAASPLPEPDKS